MTNNNYELKIISNDQTSEGKVLKKYIIDGQETVGVVENEPFQIQFKNKTWNKVQVRISIDGTDIQTGSLASTSPEGTMWFVEPYGVLSLKAWPESSNGGAEFLFSKVEDSVASNTHGNMSGKGIIAAAVFIEGYVQPSFNFGHGHQYSSINNIPLAGVFINTNSIRIGSNSLRSSRRSLTKGIRGQSVVEDSIDSCISAQSSEDNLAVGAGDYVNQQIVKVAGLTQPKLETTISVKYESWNALRSKVRNLQKNVSNPINPAFPGDAELKMINLEKTPKGRNKPSKKRLPDLQRF